MPINPAKGIVVLGSTRFCVESLAFAVAHQLGQDTLAVTSAETNFLARFATILIYMDVGLELALGLIRDITEQSPQAKVVLLGLIESKETVIKLAEAGGSGYVSLTAPMQEMVSVVRSVQAGEFISSPDVTYALFSHLARLARESLASASASALLSIRERRVMELVAENLGNKEIAERLHISEHTVKNHVHRILKKLGRRNRAALRRLEAMQVPGQRQVYTPEASHRSP
jgi:DNA-binding NarL/FixJ family response regulator